MSLADEFERLENKSSAERDYFFWQNHDRIIAALRIAEIVNDPTDEQAFEVADKAFVFLKRARSYEDAGRAVLSCLADLAKNGMEK